MCTGTVSFECLVKAKNGAKVAVIIGGKKTEFGAFRDNARDIRFPLSGRQYRCIHRPIFPAKT
jgi:hypothetical protein